MREWIGLSAVTDQLEMVRPYARHSYFRTSAHEHNSIESHHHFYSANNFMPTIYETAMAII